MVRPRLSSSFHCLWTVVFSLSWTFLVVTTWDHRLATIHSRHSQTHDSDINADGHRPIYSWAYTIYKKFLSSVCSWICVKVLKLMWLTNTHDTQASLVSSDRRLRYTGRTSTYVVCDAQHRWQWLACSFLQVVSPWFTRSSSATTTRWSPPKNGCPVLFRG